MDFNLTVLVKIGEYAVDIPLSITYENQSGAIDTITGTIHSLRDN